MGDTRLAGPIVEKTAGESLSGHRAVVVVDNEAAAASNTEASHRGKVRGITTGAVASGGKARIQVFGPMEESGWNWTPGKPIFVGVGGALTQTPPTTGWLQQIAVADSSTVIFIDPQLPIDLA